jgi:hypothetical protein
MIDELDGSVGELSIVKIRLNVVDVIKDLGDGSIEVDGRVVDR